MIENFPHSASQNIPLLEAIQAGTATSSSQLAELAGIASNNLTRKLGVLTEDNLIRSSGDETWLVELTPTGEQALRANALFRGDASALTLPGSGEQEIPFDRIDAWSGNPRSQFDPVKIEELAVNIGDKGILQPILVRPLGERFEVIIGERRRRAAVMAVQRGWVAADFMVPVRVRQLSDEEAEEIAGVENIQREDMHWMDEAKWYFKLSNRLSGAAIERLVGGTRGKRSIQDYIKCARELTPEQIARTYQPEKLHDGAPNRDFLSYVKARDEVGEKKERPALELSPKLAVTLLEVIAAGVDADVAPVLNQVVVTHFARPAVGGPLATLSVDRKLIAFGFLARDVVARTTITEDVLRWLQQLGFDNDRSGALFRARAACRDELYAHSLQAEGRWFTSELNRAEQPPEASGETLTIDPLTATQRRILREIAARSLHRHRLLDGWVQAFAEATDDPDYAALYALAFITRRDNGQPEIEIALTLAGRDHLKTRGQAPQDGLSRNSCATPWLREVMHTAAEESGAYENTAEEEDFEHQQPVIQPAPAVAEARQLPAILPSMLAIVVIEAAHKISNHGMERGPGTWGTPVLANFYTDARGSQLVQGHKMLAFLPMGEKQLVCLGKAGRDWLFETYGVGDDAGKVIVTDAMLEKAQADLLGAPVAGLYSTFWLNPPAEAEALGIDVEAEAPALAAPPPGRDQFATDMVRISAETRAFTALAAAARASAKLLTSLKQKARAPKADDVDPTVRLLEAALEAVQSYLPDAS